MKKLIVLLLSLSVCFNAGAQDLVQRYFHYNQLYTVPNFDITANTIDGADATLFRLSGGGALGNTRGGSIYLEGADLGGAGLGGDVLLESADNGTISLLTTGTGGISLNATNAVGQIAFGTNGENKWYIPQSVAGSSTLISAIGPIDTPWITTIRAANLGDGHDTNVLHLVSGGDKLSARGAYISMFGNEAAGMPGFLHLSAGNLAGGDIQLSTGGIAAWTIPRSTAATDMQMFFGAKTVNEYAIIRADTNDGSDSARLTITAGGAVGDTRGSRLDLYGSDRGGAGNGGDVLLMAGDAGDISIVSANGYVSIDDNAGGVWKNFGPVSTVTACADANGDYVTITINGVTRRIKLCDL